MSRVVIDPVTRIEGHLRIETEVNGGRVTDAWSSGTMFRGIELILRGRDPREAWIRAQRICGVCTTVHALASVRAVKDALGIQIPDNARLVRNLIAGSQNVQDLVVHFYHLHALDWVDFTLALKADPAKTARLAQSILEWPQSSTTCFKGVQDRVQALVASRQLSLFSSGDWGHPAYQLPPEANLLAVAHYIEALDMQRDFIRIHAVLGGKNPHLQTFVNQLWIPDVQAIAGFCREWFGYGEGLGNFMAYGDLPAGSIDDPSRFLFPRGVLLGCDLSTVHPVDPARVAEYVSHSWYDYSVGDQVSPAPATRARTGRGRRSAPRYDDKAVEVGPLARTLIAHTSGNPAMKQAVNGVLARRNALPTALISTLGRVAARAVEAQIVAGQLSNWVAELDDHMSRCDVRIHDGDMWDPRSSSWASSPTSSAVAPS
jgi:Ni,Fe-hydrogenase I large subunit